MAQGSICVDVSAVHLGVHAQEMHGDQRDVFGMFLQRRNIDSHDVDAIVEILAELSLSYHFAKILMRSEDNARAQRN